MNVDYITTAPSHLHLTSFPPHTLRGKGVKWYILYKVLKLYNIEELNTYTVHSTYGKDGSFVIWTWGTHTHSLAVRPKDDFFWFKA